MEKYKTFRTIFNKFKKKMHAPDLKYLVQVSSTEEMLEPVYALQVTNIADRVAPVTIYAHTEDELLEKFKDFCEKTDYDEIDKCYMQASAEMHAQMADNFLKNVKMIENRQQLVELQKKEQDEA